MIEIDKILQGIPDKLEHKSTTTHKFKSDIASTFENEEWKNFNVVEIGTSQGWSTKFLSNLFNHVYTLELDEWNIEQAKKHCDGIENITFIRGDAYRENWTKLFPEHASIVFIDCVHTYEGVQSDISNALNITESGSYLIFDDYGNPRCPGVKQAVNEAIEYGWISLVKYIGAKTGEKIVSTSDWVLEDFEGVICQIV